MLAICIIIKHIGLAKIPLSRYQENFPGKKKVVPLCDFSSGLCIKADDAEGCFQVSEHLDYYDMYLPWVFLGVECDTGECARDANFHALLGVNSV